MDSLLTLKAPNKNCSRRQFIFFFFFYLSKKIRPDFSFESSAWQRIHLKHQVLFSLKTNEKIFMNVVCCSHDPSGWCATDHLSDFNSLTVLTRAATYGL